MHITASVFINDVEPGLHADYKKWLEALAPFDASPKTYQHNRTGEDNADAHLKRQIMGREVVVAITEGQLDFGPWEQIFYGEFDGRRPKRVLVKVIGEWDPTHHSPTGIAYQLHRPFSKVDLKSMRIEQFRAEQAFLAGADQCSDKNFLTQPHKPNIKSLVDPNLMSGKFRFNGSGWCGAASIKKFFPDDERT